MIKSRYFTRGEFACQCGCGFDTVDAETLQVLEQVREEFGPVRVTSACRCPEHNAAVGGSPTSQHVRGRACDIIVAGVNPDEVADFVEEILVFTGGIGRYATFTHIDTRFERVRWKG